MIFGITHDIFHRKDLFSQIFGILAMMKTLFPQFFIEHVHGHHKDVCTPIDTDTAKEGQSLYSFFLQATVGTYVFSWKYEARRLGTVWSLRNRNWWFFAAKLALAGLIYKLYGSYGVLVLIFQAILGIFFLQVVNYVEHYGLVRKEIAPGEYEPVALKHSWNSTTTISNYIQLKLQRHSDHHKNSYVPYQNLCYFHVSPTLPCGYGVCFSVATIPSVWFKLMDPLVKQVNETGVIKIKDLKKTEASMRLILYTQACVLTYMFFIHF
mmetsp:Transcript_20695/g.38551  ORF Transcript_20695/g.38551 Transcript_20695/m.38551 type:complete len:266 (-) Transcript_20695:42-839(-)